MIVYLLTISDFYYKIKWIKGSEIVREIIVETTLDSVKLIPFLFFAFLVIEYFEHKLSNKSKKIVSKAGKFSPLIGSLLGLIPQCGFSVVATNLYITRIISLGTLVAIYLSTSDEMLPIMLSQKVAFKTILSILLIKFMVGIIVGYLIDFCLRQNKKVNNVSYEICHDEHCGCEKGDSLIKSSIIHTLKTLGYLYLITFILNLLFKYLGSQVLNKVFLGNTIFTPFITSLIGLIPNCGSSIMITELYLNKTINYASMLSGLLTGCGVALLVLFKANKNVKENIKILGIIYGIGACIGVILELLGYLL